MKPAAFGAMVAGATLLGASVGIAAAYVAVGIARRVGRAIDEGAAALGFDVDSLIDLGGNR